jgi:hypothetical protein
MALALVAYHLLLQREGVNELCGVCVHSTPAFEGEVTMSIPHASPHSAASTVLWITTRSCVYMLLRRPLTLTDSMLADPLGSPDSSKEAAAAGVSPTKAS